MKRNLLKEIETGIPSFSKGQKLLARYILDNYDKAAYMTASKLGAEVQVSESTVVRFATELGFEDCPQFQSCLRELVRTNLTSLQRMEVTNNLIGDGDILTKVLLSDMEKIRMTLEEVDRRAFEEAVDRIISAKNIYILGVRSSSSLAGFLARGLRMILGNVRFVQNNTGSELYEEILGIGPEDVMIAITFPRYSKRIIYGVDFAKAAGANVIAITDSGESPIAAPADQLLVAKSDMASFTDSLVAPLSIINAILVAVSRKKQEDVKARLQRLEDIWMTYDVYDKSRIH